MSSVSAGLQSPAAAVSPLHATACSHCPGQSATTKYYSDPVFGGRKLKYKLCEYERLDLDWLVWKMWRLRRSRRGAESMADIHIHKFVTWGWWGRELGVWTVICSRKHINFLHQHDWGRIDFMSAIEESFKTRVSPRLIKEQIVTVTDASRDF